VQNRFYVFVIAVVLVVVGLRVEFASAQRTSSAVQSWDYKVITVEEKDITATLSWKEDGRDLPGPVSALSKSKQLGADGWELISVINGTLYTNYWYKRAK